MDLNLSSLWALAAFAMTPASLLALDLNYTIDLENNLNKQRIDFPVTVNLHSISNTPVTAALVTSDDVEIPCQIDDLDGDGIADELAFVINLDANEKKSLRLRLSHTEAQKEYSPRVWANFMLAGKKKGQIADIKEVTVPGHVDFYNMVHGHGPMFESELVGYRVYFNQKQTLDPYGKFNQGLELNDTKFYPTAEHIAAGYGDDVLMAGNSCGVGAFKGWDGSKATHIEPVAYRTERLVASGPVRTVVEVEVKDWDYQGDKLDMLNRYTLYAGHRDLKVDVEFDKPVHKKIFSTGVERVMGNETQKWTDGNGLVASWGRHWPVTDTVHFAKETIGIATYIPKRYVDRQVDDADNFLYTVKIPDSNMHYYTMFTSRKETFGFPDAESWFGSLDAWREDLENPVKVTVTRTVEIP